MKIRTTSRQTGNGLASLWQEPNSGPNGTAYVPVRRASGPTGIPVLPTRPRASTDRALYLRAHAHEAGCGTAGHTVRCEPTDIEIARYAAASRPRTGVTVGRLPKTFRKVCPRQRPACTVLGCGTAIRPLRTVKKRPATAYPKPWLDRPVGGIALQKLMVTDVRAEEIKSLRATVTVTEQAIKEIRRVMRRAEAEGQLAAIGPLTADLRLWQAKRRVALNKIATRQEAMTEAELAAMEAEAEAARNRLMLAEERLEDAVTEAEHKTASAAAARAELAATASARRARSASNVRTVLAGQRAAEAEAKAEAEAQAAREKRNARDRARRAEKKRTEQDRLAAIGVNGGK